MPPLRAASLIGNALGLVLLVALCVRAVPLLAVDRAGPVQRGDTGEVAWSAPQDERAVLLIIIDALRLDIALDPRIMPTLAELARQGKVRRLQVIQPVPSTVGALPAMVEGRAVPANAALLDLTPRPAPRGGLLETLHRAGQPAEVGGTALWEGLYGRWLGPGVSIPGMPSAITDEAVLRWAARRLQALDAPPLLVVHLGRLDAVSHRHGAGETYRRTARQIDDDVAALLDVAGPAGRDVLITSDHGVTDDGGHAGGEASVRAVPVFAPDGAPDIEDDAPQTRFAHLLASRLGIVAERSTTSRANAPSRKSDAQAASIRLAPAAALALIALTGALAWSGLARLAPFGGDRLVASVWSAALWVCVAVAVLASPVIAAVMATAALALAHLLHRGAPRPGRAPDRKRLAAIGWPLLAGATLAGVEIADLRFGIPVLVPGALITLLAVMSRGAIRPATGMPGRKRTEPAAVRAARRVASGGSVSALAVGGLAAGALGGVELAIATVLAALAAIGLAARGDSVRLGVACVVCLTLLSHLSGDSASLSSLDVSRAHHAAASPGGVASAVAVALLRLFWLPGIWIVGWYHGQSVRANGPVLPLATLRGAAQTSLASMLVFAALTVFSWPSDTRVYGASLGGLLQEAGLWIGLLATLSLIAVTNRSRDRQPS